MHSLTAEPGEVRLCAHSPDDTRRYPKLALISIDITWEVRLCVQSPDGGYTWLDAGTVSLQGILFQSRYKCLPAADGPFHLTASLKRLAWLLPHHSRRPH